MSKLKIHKAESPRDERVDYTRDAINISLMRVVIVDVECGQQGVPESRAVDRWPKRDWRLWKHGFCKKCAWRRGEKE